MKRKSLFVLSFALMAVIALVFTSCGEDAPLPTGEASYTANELMVAFSIEATDADSYSWDFGDQSGTSSEEEPIYTYSATGTYDVTCTVKGEGGSKEVVLSVAVISLEDALQTHTWKLDQASPVGVYHCRIGDDGNIAHQEDHPAGIVALLGFAEEYADTWAFTATEVTHVAGGNDSVLVGGYFAAIMNMATGGLYGYRSSAVDDAVCLGPFAGTTTTYSLTDRGDYTINVVPDEDYPTETEDLTFENVRTISVDGTSAQMLFVNEFIGLQDFVKDYVVFEVYPEKITIGIFITAGIDEASVAAGIMPPPTHFLKMSLTPASK